MVPSLKPVDRPAGLADQVYTTLRDYLGSHVIRPGQRLQEAALALQLGVSRTPVREALARLESEGLIARRGPQLRRARSSPTPTSTRSTSCAACSSRPRWRRSPCRSPIPKALSRIAAALQDAEAAEPQERRRVLHRGERAVSRRLARSRRQSPAAARARALRRSRALPARADAQQRRRAQGGAGGHEEHPGRAAQARRRARHARDARASARRPAVTCARCSTTSSARRPPRASPPPTCGRCSGPPAAPGP